MRQLAASGDLPARKLAGAWLVDAVQARARAAPVAGRPLSARMCWLILRSLEGYSPHAQDRLEHQAGLQPVLFAQDWPPSSDRRERHRVLLTMENAPPVDQWARWMRRRADLHRFYVHAKDLPAVVRRYKMEPDPAGEVQVMALRPDAVASGAVSLGPGNQGRGQLPVAAALVDLLESPDVREHHFARSSLDQALQGWRERPNRRRPASAATRHQVGRVSP